MTSSIGPLLARAHAEVGGGAYELLRLIGNSGGADVYEARQVSLDRSVALKVLRTSLTEEREPRERFLARARTGARLHHPHICAIYEASILEDGAPFVAMELLTGESMNMLLHQEQRLSTTRTLAIMVQVCLALDAARAAGVTHGALSPEDVHLEPFHALPDFVKVRGFGFVHDPEGLMGPARYLSPERIHGNGRPEQWDIYAVGTILYEALAGEPPFPDHRGVMPALKARLEREAPDIPGAGFRRGSTACPWHQPTRQRHLLAGYSGVPRVLLRAPRCAGTANRRASPIRLTKPAGPRPVPALLRFSRLERRVSRPVPARRAAVHLDEGAA